MKKQETLEWMYAAILWDENYYPEHAYIHLHTLQTLRNKAKEVHPTNMREGPLGQACERVRHFALVVFPRAELKKWLESQLKNPILLKMEYQKCTIWLEPVGVQPSCEGLGVYCPRVYKNGVLLLSDDNPEIYSQAKWQAEAMVGYLNNGGLEELEPNFSGTIFAPSSAEP